MTIGPAHLLALRESAHFWREHAVGASFDMRAFRIDRAERLEEIATALPGLIDEIQELKNIICDICEGQGIAHDEPGCPEDDTCRCENIAKINRALSGGRP